MDRFTQYEILKFYIGGEHHEAAVENPDFDYELRKHLHVFHVVVELLRDITIPIHPQSLSEKVLAYLRNRWPDFDFGPLSCSDIAMVIADFLDDYPDIGPRVKKVTVTADNESGGYAC